jgi:hypothetical protein
MDPNRYNNIITTIVRVAFRKLEDYIKNAGVIENFRHINANEEKVLRAPLVNANKWMSADELDTFYKIIRMDYRMKHNPI